MPISISLSSNQIFYHNKISWNIERYWQNFDFASLSFWKYANSYFDSFVMDNISSNSVTLFPLLLMTSKILRLFKNAEPKGSYVICSSRILSKQTNKQPQILQTYPVMTWHNYNLTQLTQTLSSQRPPLQLKHHLHHLPTYQSNILVKWKFPSNGKKSLKNQVCSALCWPPSEIHLCHKTLVQHLIVRWRYGIYSWTFGRLYNQKLDREQLA